MTSSQVSFIDVDVQRCPFPAYAEVRKDGPIYYDASCSFYIVTGYDEVRAAASDVELFSSVTGQLLVKQAPYQSKIDAVYREHGFLPPTTTSGPTAARTSRTVSRKKRARFSGVPPN